MEPVEKVPPINQTVTSENPPSLKPKDKSKKSHKKLILLLGLFIALTIIIGIFGIYYVSSNNEDRTTTQNIVKENKKEKTIKTSPTPTPINISSWKTYTNTKIGFTIKYPPDSTPQTIFGLGMGPVKGDEDKFLEFCDISQDGYSCGGDNLKIEMTKYGDDVKNFILSNKPAELMGRGCKPIKLINEKVINNSNILFTKILPLMIRLYIAPKQHILQEMAMGLYL